MLPEFPEDQAIVLESKVLREMIRKSAYSMSTGERRYIFHGVYFILDKGSAKMVATDGRRLAYIARDIADKKTTTQVIIPSKAVREVERMLGADGASVENVSISVTENQVAFKIGETVIISRLIEGHFPNYEQVIPKTSTIHLQMATKDLLTMTQRAALGSGDRGGAVKFVLDKGRLRAIGTAQGRVEVEDELPVEYDGTTLEIAFNPFFVQDVLKNVEASQIVMEFSSSLNPRSSGRSAMSTASR